MGNVWQKTVSPWRLWLLVILAAMYWSLLIPHGLLGVPFFWMQMVFADLTLVMLALANHTGMRRDAVEWLRRSTWSACMKQLLLGACIAALLWGVFWIGDRLSSLLFDFARPQVELIYGLKNTGRMGPGAVSLLLLLCIGPAEEWFWRGFVQRSLGEVWGKPFPAFVVTAVLYALIHVCSLNFMLVMAALVAGLVWGFLYWLKPSWLPALVVSHALWDAAVFVWFPI